MENGCGGGETDSFSMFLFRSCCSFQVSTFLLFYKLSPQFIFLNEECMEDDGQWWLYIFLWITGILARQTVEEKVDMICWQWKEHKLLCFTHSGQKQIIYMCHHSIALCSLWFEVAIKTVISTKYLHAPSLAVIYLQLLWNIFPSILMKRIWFFT